MSSGMFESLRVSATGMSSQRVKMDVVAQNIANAETTRAVSPAPTSGTCPAACGWCARTGARA
jgi:flagellar basal body rod protein FlgC